MIPFSDKELMPVVEKSLEKIKPILALDGGGIKFLDIRNGIVFVQLQGACAGCSSSNQSLKYIVERQLRMDIHPEIKVINIPFGEESTIEEIAKGLK